MFYISFNNRCHQASEGLVNRTRDHTELELRSASTMRQDVTLLYSSPRL